MDVRIAGPDIVLSAAAPGRPDASVRVAGIDGAVQFWLTDVRGVVETERSFVDRAGPVLERFVARLLEADDRGAS